MRADNPSPGGFEARARPRRTTHAQLLKATADTMAAREVTGRLEGALTALRIAIGVDLATWPATLKLRRLRHSIIPALRCPRGR
jgi:hypothetical protein